MTIELLATLLSLPDGFFYGGIYQGTGTFASPTTGLKIWNDSGIGRIAGYNSGDIQWYCTTDGKFALNGLPLSLNTQFGTQIGTFGAYATSQLTNNPSIRLDISGASAARSMELYVNRTGYNVSAIVLTSGVSTAVDGVHLYATSSAKFSVLSTGVLTNLWINTIGLTITSTTPTLQLYDSDAGTDEKFWRYYANGQNCIFDLPNDAYTAANMAFYINRTGYVPNFIDFAIKAFINDTANSKMTMGLTINQGGADDEIFALKSTDISHGFTTDTEADTYCCMRKNNATNGGVILDGYGSGALGIRVGAAGQTGDTTKATTSGAKFLVESFGLSGSTRGSVGANENIAAFRNATTTRFILDGDGDSHQDVGTAWTNFDTHNDVELLTALSVQVSRESDPSVF